MFTVQEKEREAGSSQEVECQQHGSSHSNMEILYITNLSFQCVAADPAQYCVTTSTSN